MDALSGVRHGFFTRRRGVNQGLYDSLNGGFGSNDDEIAVTENRRRAVDRLGLGDAPLCTVYQCHGVDCVTVTAPWLRHQAPRADAMVTNRRGVEIMAGNFKIEPPQRKHDHLEALLGRVA